MTSIGFLEIFIVLGLMIFAFNAKQIAQIFHWFQQMRNKFQQTKIKMQDEFQQILLETPQSLNTSNTKEEWRKWGKKEVQKIPQKSMLDRVQSVIEFLETNPHYQKANRIGAFYGKLDEIETTLILKKILSDKKELFLPYCKENQMHFSQIFNIYTDLETGPLGIKEPKQPLQTNAKVTPKLLLIPGLVFDTYGGRLGRGKGFYDFYLKNHSVFKIGICLDTQITDKKLSLDQHDQKMNILISESRILQFE